MNDTKPTKDQLIGWLFTLYGEDEDFMKLLNDMTYSRKLQLRSKRKQKEDGGMD